MCELSRSLGLRGLSGGDHRVLDVTFSLEPSGEGRDVILHLGQVEFEACLDPAGRFDMKACPTPCPDQAGR
jgi:hypothetical protein